MDRGSHHHSFRGKPGCCGAGTDGDAGQPAQCSLEFSQASEGLVSSEGRQNIERGEFRYGASRVPAYQFYVDP